MNYLIRFFQLLLLLACIPFICGQRGCIIGTPTSELFEQAWSDFDQHYSYFTYKNVDWNAVKQQYAPNFQEEMDAEQFAQQLNEMLQVLHDWHVSVASPTGNVYGYDGSYNVNRPDWSVTSQYITDATDLANGTITHGIVGNNIAYIDIVTLEDSAFRSITDNAIDEIFQKYANADGMIIDIRANNGGNEENAALFCSRLTDESYEYGYTTTRNGPNHDDFDPPVSHALDPNAGTHFSGPVVGLIGKRCMSSAEWFTLMMKRNPNIALIGERTRGASGFPQTYELPNRVSYAISSWMAYTYYDKVIEDNGVPPDIGISSEQSFDDTHDYVLERAITYIETGETPPATTTVPDGTNTTTTVPGADTTTSTSISGDPTTTTSVSSGSGAPIIDSFTVEPTSGVALQTIFTFTCTAHDPDGTGIQFYCWDMGDGFPAECLFLSQYQYVYFVPGEYTARVQVGDYQNELSDIASLTVTVTE